MWYVRKTFRHRDVREVPVELMRYLSRQGGPILSEVLDKACSYPGSFFITCGKYEIFFIGTPESTAPVFGDTDLFLDEIFDEKK